MTAGFPKLSAFVLLAASAAAFAAAPGEGYPARPVRVITAQSAGSSLDTIARIVMNQISEASGQQFVIDNRGGAGGTIGLEIAARATPDGYTITAGASSSMIVSTFTYRKLGFDTLKDFAPISQFVNTDAVLIVNPGVPAKTVKELVALAKARPGKLNMASAGVGSSSHLSGAMFSTLAGIDTVHVPYKGGGPMAASLVAGESQWGVGPSGAFMGHVKAGRLRMVAIGSKQRSPLFPDLPTIDEAGVPGYEYSSWNGVFAPRGTPRPIIMRLHALIQAALADREVARLYAAQGVVPRGSKSPEEFGAAIKADYARIAKLVKVAGIKPE
ncbi:MAG: tripartite tricarboxylate transporter substrate binding protein [Burkholderiales bacterium]|nr:tripartite tricarboxylate transporter substrate binding protein [Burkholderiales bacterium]